MLTTWALDPRSLRWFEACPCRPTSEDLPPSPVQLRAVERDFHHSPLRSWRTRSRRTEFPYRAPQGYSLSHSRAIGFSLFPSVRLACLSGPTCPAQVSFEGYVSSSAPSPCDRRYRLRVLYGLIRLPTDPPSSSVWLGRRTCQQRTKVVRLRLTSVSGFPLTWLNSRRSYTPSVVPGANGASQVPDVSLHACHALMTPADPPESRP